MDCRYCPKKNKCSGADCYYDYYPEPPRELAEDMAMLNNEATIRRPEYKEV